MEAGIGHLSVLDAAILIAALIGVTVFGHYMSGVAKSHEEFFAGDGTVPWLAVSVSIVATSMSAVSVVSIPAIVFRDGGDLTFFQVILGWMVGTFLIAIVFAKPYYQCRQAETTIDYVELRLNQRTGAAVLVLGYMMLLLVTSAQLLTSALVLSVILDWSLTYCIAVMVAASIAWSIVGGVKTVIWTDFTLFVMAVGGAMFAAIWSFVASGVGLAEAYAILDGKAKLTLLDISTDPKKSYTLWAGLIGAAIYHMNNGCWQSSMQRIRAARSAGDARKAYMFASALVGLTFVMLIVGVGLTVFYSVNELPAEFAQSLVSEPDRIFPYFVVSELPPGVSALMIAAIFAAGISTLDSRLAEAADITVTNVLDRFRFLGQRANYRLPASRILIVVWGCFFGALAYLLSDMQAQTLMILTLKMPAYFGGAFLGTFLLARAGVGNSKFYFLALIFSLLTAAGLDYIGVSFFWWPISSAAVIFFMTWAFSRERPEWSGIEVLNPQSASRIESRATDY